MKAELARRVSLCDRLEAFLKKHPGEWLTMQELRLGCGAESWRTRLSDLSKKRSMRIEWNGQNGVESRHRYLPYEPVGRDPSRPASGQAELFR